MADVLPPELAPLRERMATAIGLDAACILPVRGLWHGVALLLRGERCAVAAPKSDSAERAARAYGFSLVEDGADVVVRTSPDPHDGGVVTAAEAALSSVLVVVDETLIAFGDRPSCALAAGHVIVIRNLGLEFGLQGEPCAALIGAPDLVEACAGRLEPDAFAPSTISLAMAALDPQKAYLRERRIRDAKSEVARIKQALANRGVLTPGQGPFVFVRPENRDTARSALARHGAQGAWVSAEIFRIDVGAPELNDRALLALGAISAPSARRTGEVLRETKETRITARVDLGHEGGSRIETGLGFFDHMLEQVAAHGGFTLELRCDGDLHVDAHHSIEDCAIAFGQALRQALGEKRGIARYGFLLPMDEAEARLSIDLGGRPYLVWEAAFTAPLLGAYPTEMTEHVFRSLAQSLGASIHVSVKGENDHHKTEACFKALGRALRQAVRIEGDATPSTKGMLA